MMYWEPYPINCLQAASLSSLIMLDINNLLSNMGATNHKQLNLN